MKSPTIYKVFVLLLSLLVIAGFISFPKHTADIRKNISTKESIINNQNNSSKTRELNTVLQETQLVQKKDSIAKEHNFEVLFLYKLVQNCFKSNTDKETSPGLFITEALILLLKQFKI